jgi:hypothetical protein
MHRFVLASLAALGLAAAAGPALAAAIIFDDIGAGYDCCAAYPIGQGDSIVGKQDVAARFVAPTNDVISAIDFGMISLAGDNRVDFALYADSAGTIGPLITVSQGLTVPEGCCDTTTPNVDWTNVGVPVVAGRAYWIGGFANTDFTVDGWDLNTEGIVGDLFRSDSFRSDSDYSVGILPAFIVLGGGAPIPEPGTWWLLAVGAGLGGAMLRTRRNAAPAADWRRYP